MINILIVDNQIPFREILAKNLDADPEVRIIGIADLINEVIELCSQSSPDILLIEYSIFENFSKNIQLMELIIAVNIKIVVLTETEEESNLFTAIRLGACGFLSKSLRPTKLILALKAVINGEGALSRVMTRRLMDEFSRTRPTEPLVEKMLEKLTQREREIFKYIVAGKKNPEIAADLYLAENTVKYHVHSILGKLKLTNRKAAADFAREYNLIGE